MDLRRGLLLLAIGLLFVAGLSTLLRPAAPPEEAPPVTATAPDSSRGDQPMPIRFAAEADPPSSRTVKAGEHVVITVTATEPGLVQLEGLGQLAPAGPGTPATFDLVLDEPGRFDAVFMPTDGLDRRAGTIVVRGRAPR